MFSHPQSRSSLHALRNRFTRPVRLARLGACALAAALVLAFAVPAAADGATVNTEEVNTALAAFKQKPELKKLFVAAYGYAVFPTVTRGALGIGGAYGEGGVFNQKKLVARTTLTALSIGLGAGGEAYSEIIFFENKAAYDKFASGKVELGARANAVAIKNGVAAEAAFADGMAVVTSTKGGLMADASVGGQKFGFEKL